jgi:superfamily II DNA or RNA helicase
MNPLRENQTNAIQVSLENDFESGVHYQATGTGKSWIAMHLIFEFHQKYPKSNIMWICEKKSILIEQFKYQNLKERNFDIIFEKFNILNFSEFKLSDWYNSVNTSIYWNKPVLLIINRAFLTSNDKYKKIKIPFHLVIHDECHTIINKSTKEFYEYILSKDKLVKCIGFSATPSLMQEPYKKIITSYSIYDAFLENVIVPPKILWFSCDDILDYEEIIVLLKEQIVKAELVYKKIIIWCGMIDLCFTIGKLCAKVFPDYLLCMDTSSHNNKKKDIYGSYEEFYDREEKAILFCAAKHREGSDIKNLDGCVFLDKVENRCPKVFLQCIGRVLRKDKNNKKKYGLVIDLKAKSSLAICNTLNQYLNLPSNIFPWTYHYTTSVYHNKLIKINELQMIEVVPINKANTKEFAQDQELELRLKNENSNTFSKEDLIKRFIRKIPDNSKDYIQRLDFELLMLENKNLIPHLIQALQILDLTKNIPHVTRGSCGSSLVCYMLGISHIDPVKNNIKFARFLTNFRNNLPDIDLDFPHNLRDEVFLKIGIMWPGKVARISNHVYFHDKSALRQAIRNAGIRKFIGKNEIVAEISKLPRETKNFIMKEKEKLENTFRCYSLHCGGIVYYPDGIPDDLLLNSKNNNSHLKQINMNKYDVAKEKNFKIDILSSRALSQCYEANHYQSISFEEFVFDQKTFDMLHRGDNLGIILGESSLMRKAFMIIKPKSLHDLAVCLSIIRPAAMNARNNSETEDFKNHIIFDDDAINMIGTYLNIDDEKADMYRRAFAKGDKKGIQAFKDQLNHFPKEEQKEIMKKLSNLARYGFCKSHAFSYAQLIWKLAYMKAHHPFEFWKATLNNCVSSYKKWVHYYEAKLSGVDFSKELLKRNDVSIYANNRRKKIEDLTPQQQLQKYGYWIINNNNDFFPGCYLTITNTDIYYFNGIIASVKITKFNKKKKLILFIGVESQKYIQVIIENIQYFDGKKIGIQGIGKCLTENDEICSVVTATKYSFY